MKEFKTTPSVTGREGEAVKRYLVDIGRIPLLTIDEEIELAQKIRRGGAAGKKAQKELVNANLRFVVSVAKQYQHQGLPLMDVINEGNIGLLKAAEKFDETRGFKFISYAVWWIRQSILQALAEKGRMVRLPLNQVGALNKINNAINRFEQENQRRPTGDELAEITGMEEEKIVRCGTADGRPTSLDSAISDDDDNTRVSMLPGGDGDRADRLVDDESMRDEISTVLCQVLKDREIVILRECFGVGGSEKGLDEIGHRLGLTRERVRQIKENGLAKLRESRDARVLRKYLG